MIKLILGAALLMLTLSARSDGCDVGPTYCVDTQAYRDALASKKKVAAKEYPARLVALYDKLDHCEAAVTTAPTGFQVMRVKPNNDITSDAWTTENESADAKQVKSGALKACYVILARYAFACGHAADYRNRPDYDSGLDLSRSMALQCQ